MLNLLGPNSPEGGSKVGMKGTYRVASTVGESVAVAVGNGVRVGKADVGVGMFVGARGTISPDVAVVLRAGTGLGVKVAGTIPGARVKVRVGSAGSVAAATNVGIATVCVDGAWHPTKKTRQIRLNQRQDRGG